MAILRVPRITTAQRGPLVLQEAEIVFDTDLKKFFGGDGITAGGIEICSGYCPPSPAVEMITTESGDVITTESGDPLEI